MAPDVADMAAKERSATLNDLYQQLKELDSMDFLEQKMKIYRPLWERDPGPDPEFEKAIREEQLASLKDLVGIAGELQSSLRKTINIVSRPTLRPLHILDMPDEVLINISGHVKGWKPDESYFCYDYPKGMSEIKNLRLTCRRFCSASSHLLKHAASVELTPSSLSRLEEISHHPGVRKGVRAVRVLLHFYDSALAHSIHDFAEYSAYKLRDTTETIELMATRSDSMRIYNRPKEAVLEKVQEAKTILAAWEGIANGTPDDLTDQEDLRYRMVLRRTHAEYRRRFTDQETLLEDGTFARAVAAAIARMPIATRLEVRDNDVFHRASQIDYFDHGNESLAQRLLLPMRWEEGMDHQLGEPPAELLVKLPTALHKAGVSLTHLNIEVSPLQKYASIAPSEADLHAMTASVQKLKEFSFVSRGKEASFYPPREASDVEALRKYLTALLDTASIEDIWLSLDFLWDDDSLPSFSLGSIVTFRRWQKLYSFSINGVPLHLAEVERFVYQLSPATILMTMATTRLLSGTWAEALDVVRKKSTPYYWSIDHPSGGELDTMSNEERAAIFDKSKGSDRSLADKYLRGLIDYNPLTDREGQ